MQSVLVGMPDSALAKNSSASIVLSALGLVPSTSGRTSFADELQQRKQQDEDAADAAAAAQQAPTPTQIIQEDERQQAPGSRAARDAQLKNKASAQAERSQQISGEVRPAESRADKSGEPTAKQASVAGTKATESANADNTAKTISVDGNAALRKQLAQQTEAKTSTESNASSQSGGSATKTTSSTPAVAAVQNTGTNTNTNTASAAARAAQSSVAAVSRAASAAASNAASTAAGSRTGGNVVQAAAGGPETRATTSQRGSATTTSTASSAETRAENTDAERNIDRMVRVLSQQINERSARTVMRLDPPELGSLRLYMDLRDETLSLRVQTSTGVAHRLLSEDVERLRRGLEASGIRLERIEIQPPVAEATVADAQSSAQSETHTDMRDHSAGTDAEHRQESGKESHPVETIEEMRLEPEQPVAESLVNVIA